MIPPTVRRAVSCLLVPVLILGSATSCRKRDSGTAAAPPPPLPAALHANNLGPLPGPVYSSQADSPIRWQPWTEETFRLAEKAERLVLAVIALPQQPGFQEVLAALEADPAAVAAINNHYVPVLVDGDAAREMGLLTADLCAEIKRPLGLPLFLWLTWERNPVAWIPVSGGGRSGVAEVFDQSHSMVARTWRENRDYVMENSARDNDGRRERIGRRKNAIVASERPAEDAVAAARRLAGLYDPVSRTFDEAGGLFPAGAMELMAAASALPDVPAETRTRSREALEGLLEDLLPSAMFDPLDGGVYSLRWSKSWALPGYVRDCVIQARVALALAAAHHATGNPLALERAREVVAFAEKQYGAGNGLFSVGMAADTDVSQWLWSVEEVEKALPAEDAAWWISVTGMDPLGNIPYEVDPARKFFRGNAIALSRPVAELAAGFPDPEAFPKRFEEIRKTLLQARRERFGEGFRDATPHAGATFRMISAYAAMFTATGDAAYREKAAASLAAAREAFADGPRLRAYPGEAPPEVVAGRAFLYALAIHASLDVADVTGDERALLWADDLASTAAELFTAGEYLKEAPDNARILDLPVTDVSMLFDDSTAGLFSLLEARMAARGRPLAPGFSQLATPLPVFAEQQPILHSDLIMATIVRHFGPVVALAPEAAPELAGTVRQLPLRWVRRGAGEPGEAGALVAYPGAPEVPVSTQPALEEALLRGARDQ